MSIRFLAVLAAFYVMGFGDVRGSLVGIAKEGFGISAAQGSLIPCFGALAFGLCALPAGLLASRVGKKAIILLGLAITAGGHLLPAFRLRGFGDLLLAVFIIGVGMTLLLVAGNPLLRDVTAPARFARNLTFAQFIKSLGSVSGPFCIATIVSLGYGWQGLFPVFAGLSLVALLAVAVVRIPETLQARPATLGAMLRLLRQRPILLMLMGIFLFVGSEMGMNTWLASHMWETHGLGLQVDAIRYGQGLFWISQGAGRLLGTLVLNWMAPRRFFVLCALAGLAGLAGLILGQRPLAIGSVALCGLSFANIWPTLFALLLETRPDRDAELAGLTVMANSGGAVLPLLMGAVTDYAAVRWCFLVPVAAFLYLAVMLLLAPARRERVAPIP